MSTSTDGLLCYGFLVNNEGGEGTPEFLYENLGEDDEFLLSFEEFLCKTEGITPYTITDDEYKNNPIKLKAWKSNYNIRDKIEKDYPISLECYCSAECDMYILCITESVSRVWRGDEIRLGQNINSKPEWKQQLKDFCKKAQIKYKAPEWLLTSYWG